MPKCAVQLAWDQLAKTHNTPSDSVPNCVLLGNVFTAISQNACSSKWIKMCQQERHKMAAVLANKNETTGLTLGQSDWWTDSQVFRLIFKHTCPTNTQNNTLSFPTLMITKTRHVLQDLVLRRMGLYLRVGLGVLPDWQMCRRKKQWWMLFGYLLNVLGLKELCRTAAEA